VTFTRAARDAASVHFLDMVVCAADIYSWRRLYTTKFGVHVIPSTYVLRHRRWWYLWYRRSSSTVFGLPLTSSHSRHCLSSSGGWDITVRRVFPPKVIVCFRLLPPVPGTVCLRTAPRHSLYQSSEHVWRPTSSH